MSKEMYCALRKKGTLGLYIEITQDYDDETCDYELDTIQYATLFYDTDDAQEYQKKLKEQHGLETEVIIVDLCVHDEL